MKSKANHLVFVYGTLRYGASNHHLMQHAAFLEFQEIAAFLYRVDWYPALVLNPSASSVIGEVYTISEELLQKLDDYEGDEYQRVSVDFLLKDGRCAVWLWQWRGSVEHLVRIESGDWLAVS